ncbi:Snf7-domain-containing protein [Mycena belliarum]|uniref:Snf7-domain-containing protein n=1 Tax=Mycena belliarum TaxID=1033014 RepID=A0AAD6UDI8_9AGAR|nr:Snf7-domain-containing protein [Mycena belliae]
MSTNATSPALLALPPYASTGPSRLQALYSDISRQKHSNPASYHANIEWWRSALEAIARSGIQQHGSKLGLTAGPSLLDLLRVSGVGKPLALPAVVTELRSQKLLFTREDFMNSKESVYAPGWLPGRIAAYVVGKPLWWALEQLGVVGEEGLIPNTRVSEKDTTWWGDYVMISLAESAANAVLAKQSLKAGGPSDVLYSLESFKREFSTVLSPDSLLLSDSDAKILVRFLERDRRAVIVDKDVIKFSDADNVNGVREITAVDRGILELKDAVQHLHDQVTEFQRKIDQYTQKASTALQQKHKPVALTFLRFRKQFEDLLRKRLGSLETLEATLISVETAAGDVEIMKSYESSTATLKSILAHPSLRKDAIDKTMDALAEANADAKDIEDTIRIGGDIAMGIDATAFDETELEEELQKLAQEAEDEAADNARVRLAQESLRSPQRLPSPAPVEPVAEHQSVLLP